MLLILATYANPDGSNIYPGMELLMEDTNRKKTAVYGFLRKLEEYGLLIHDGRQGHTRRFRLKIPDVTPTILDSDISKEKWESMWEPEEDETVRVPVVMRQEANRKPMRKDMLAAIGHDMEKIEAQTSPEPPTGTALVVYDPPGNPPEAAETDERLQRDLGVLQCSLDLVAKGILTYDAFMRGGRRKGFSDDFLNYLFTGGATGSSNGSQPYDEPETNHKHLGKDVSTSEYSHCNLTT